MDKSGKINGTRELKLGHKAKARGREFKTYIQQEIFDQLEMQYYTSFNQKMPYGYMTKLINDALALKLKEWQAARGVTELVLLPDHTGIQSAKTPLSLLLGFMKNKLVPALNKYRSRAASPLKVYATLNVEDVSDFDKLIEEIIALTRATFQEVDFVAPKMLKFAEPEDKTLKLDKETQDKVAAVHGRAAARSLGLDGA